MYPFVPMNLLNSVSVLSTQKPLRVYAPFSEKVAAAGRPTAVDCVCIKQLPVNVWDCRNVKEGVEGREKKTCFQSTAKW